MIASPEICARKEFQEFSIDKNLTQLNVLGMI
jgi:hypothetical protein